MALTKITSTNIGANAVTTSAVNLTAPLGFANSSANVVYMAANGSIGIGISTNTTRKLQIDGTNAMGTGSGVEDLIALTNQNGETSGVAEDRIGFTISAQSNVADRRIGMYARAGNANFNNPDISFWQSGQGIAYRETMRIRADTATLQFNSGYGSVASAYGCRAWANFNGTGTIAIRASGNISSLTDYGVGDYGFNFSNAMPDQSYVIVGGGIKGAGGPSATNCALGVPGEGMATTNSGIGLIDANGSAVDRSHVFVAIFR